MNLTLKSDLEKAYNFLKNYEKCEKDMASCDNLLRRSQAKVKYTIRDYRDSLAPKTDDGIHWYHIYFFAVFLIGSLFLYAVKKLFAKSFEKRELKKDLKYKEEYDVFIKEEKEKVNKLSAELNRLIVKKMELERQKSLLSVVPYAPYRTKEAIKYMYESVARGYSVTIQQAMNRYQKHLIAMDELRQRQEEREENERRYKETRDYLEKIAKQQENINDNLEYIRRHRN